jgi:hypothetical protein
MGAHGAGGLTTCSFDLDGHLARLDVEKDFADRVSNGSQRVLHRIRLDPIVIHFSGFAATMPTRLQNVAAPGSAGGQSNRPPKFLKPIR